MGIDNDPFEEPPFPRKLLDKKAYVRLDPETGEPELVRVEPSVTENGEYILETVVIIIDNATPITMQREMAQSFLEQHHCVPLEEVAEWKHRLEN